MDQQQLYGAAGEYIDHDTPIVPQHLEDPEREQTLRSIRYLASHVPTAVLKRLSEETKALIHFPKPQMLNEQFLKDLGGVLLDPVDQSCSGSLIETNSDISEMSDLSHLSEEEGEDKEDEKPDESGAFEIHQRVETEEKYEEELRVYDHEIPIADGDTKYGIGRGAEREAARDVVRSYEKQQTIVLESTIDERPRRQRTARRSSMASQVSILSHRYFQNAPKLPYASKHESALLFVDISGFTRLSTLLSPENLSRAINEYFQLIVNEVTQHNGDILKFAGDALFAEWKVRSHRSIIGKSSIEANVRMNMEDCVTSAAICAAKIVSKFSNHCIVADITKPEANADNSPLTLNVHCGISKGELVSVHVGDNETRREYLVMGKPIEEVAKAEERAALGEVAACPDSARALSKTCELHASVKGAFDDGCPVVIANQSGAMFTPMRGYEERYANDAKEDPLESRVARLLEGWSNAELLQFRKLLSLYVHPVVSGNDEANFNLSQSRLKVQSRHLQEAELRNVFVMFIMPTVSISVTGDDEIDMDQSHLLNNIMNVTTSELDRFGGHLRQYIVDDKGLVLIATFGLRGSTFPNMVAERALPTAHKLHAKLLSDLNVRSQIGATIGRAYCGVIGGLMRHEYAVLGPSVNLAARLMCSKMNSGVLVSKDVRSVASKTYGFKSLGSVKAKGYPTPVPVYEPLTALKRTGGSAKTRFVGRDKELKKLDEIALEMSSSASHSSRLVLVSGESGLGKTSLVAHGIEKIRQKMDTLKKRSLTLKQVCNERDAFTPFGSFGPLLFEALFKSQEITQHGKGRLYSMSSSLSGSSKSIGTLSVRSRSSVGGVSHRARSQIASLLYSLCKELNAPSEFAELVGHHLLQVDASAFVDMSKASNTSSAANSDKSLVTFMAELFHYCTRDNDLVMIALDDVHLSDELSWKVIQQLFEIPSNCLIICTCRPLGQYKLAIDGDFWDELQSEHVATGKYVSLELNRLDESETADMIARTLGIQREFVDSHIQRRVFYQSLGIPQFIHVLLDSIKKDEMTIAEDRDDEDERADSVSCLSSAGTVPVFLGQLLLQRIDKFSGSGRSILNLAAVLGLSFDVLDLLDVLENQSTAEMICPTLQDIGQTVQETLASAVNEGIMHTDYLDESNQEELAASLHSEGMGELQSECGAAGTIMYSFTHDVWRVAILNLVLDKRKRQLHAAVAITLESYSGDSGVDGYLSQVRVFSHWKQSGNVVKAGTIALDIGKTYVSLGLHEQSIRLYQEALDSTMPMPAESETHIKLYVALGKAYASTGRFPESVVAYQNALTTLNDASGVFIDRSIAFPVFSGLFLLIRWGVIEQDKDCSYEQELVAHFVSETKLHGDPVHYARSLATQAETLARLNKFDSALTVNTQLRSIYVPELHSEGISTAYGSDRAAQSISVSAVWFLEVGKMNEALETCDVVMNELLPKMNPRNVHNSCVLLLPIFWILRDHEKASLVKDAFQERVVDAFKEYYGEGGSTPIMYLHSPMLMLLDLHLNKKGELERFEEYLRWASCEDNLRFGTRANSGCLVFGGPIDCISADICLLLAKRVECESAAKKHLISSGTAVCREALALATEKKSRPCIRVAESILGGLEELEMDY